MRTSHIGGTVIAEMAIAHRYRTLIVSILIASFTFGAVINPAYGNQPPHPPTDGPTPCSKDGGTGKDDSGKGNVYCPAIVQCYPNGGNDDNPCTGPCGGGGGGSCGCDKGKTCGRYDACYKPYTLMFPGAAGGGGTGTGCDKGDDEGGGGGTCSDPKYVPNSFKAQGGRVPPSSTEHPIYLKLGSVTEGATDLRVVAPGLTWTQTRSYDSTLTGAGPLGNRWVTSSTDFYLVDSGVGKDLIYTASAKYSFTGDDNTTYTPPTGMRVTLEYKATPHEYWFTNIDTGAIAIFHDFSVDPEEDRGRLKEFTSRTWNTAGKTGTTYAYTYHEHELESITITTAGEQAFSIVSELALGHLKSLSVYDDSETLIKKVEYIYFEDSELWGDAEHEPSFDVGDIGDLVCVKVSTRAAGDTGTLSIIRYTMYRYEPGSRLKGVFNHAAIMRALAHFGETNPLRLISLGDDSQMGGSGPKVKDYANRWFTYYSGNLKTDNSGSGGGDPKCLTAWEPSAGENLESKYGGAGRDETYFVKSERVGAGQCASCGGGTSGITFNYYFMELDQGETNDDNEVKYLVVEDATDPTGPQHRTVYGLNSEGRKLRDVFIDNPVSSPKFWCQSWTLNATSDWNNAMSPKPLKRFTLSEYRPPSAHDVNSTNVAQFLDPYDEGMGGWTYDTATLRTASNSAAGPTYVYTYDAYGQETDKKIKRGCDSTDLYYLSATDYGNGSTVPTYMPIKYYVYPAKTATRSAGVQWTMTYDFWDGGMTQLRKSTTTYPAISTSQNGSGLAATAELWFDKLGRQRWAKNAEGYVTYFSYEVASGQLGYTVVDVDPSTEPSGASDSALVDWDDDGNGTYSSSDKPTRGSGLPNVLALITRQHYDNLGRPTLVTNPGGDRHATVYETNRTIHFPYINTGGVPQMPIQVSVLNSEAQIAETFNVKANFTDVDTDSGVPTGFTSGHEPTQADYVSWTRYGYDTETGSLTQVDAYHDIPSSGAGTISTNFYRTVFQYDVEGRRTYTIQQVSGGPTSGNNGVEQVTQLIYDKRDRIVEVKRGVSGAGSNIGANHDNYPTLATVSKTYYDGGDDTTPLKVGDSFVSSSKRFYGTGSSDYVGTNFQRTYRGDVRGVEQTNGGTAFSPWTVMDIDWLGRATGTAQYTSAPTWSSLLTGDGYTDYLSGHSTARNDWTKTTYDDMGYTYRVERYPGTDGTNHFESNNYYDRMGRLIASGDKYSAKTEYAYDGAGRQYEQRTIKQLASPDGTYGQYNSGGAFTYVAPTPKRDIGSMSGGDAGVIEMTHTAYDAFGNGTEQHSFELNHNDTDGIDLSNNDDYIRNTVFNWYDSLNRLTTTADYGSGNETSGSTTWWAYTTLPSRPSEPGWTSSNVYNGYIHLTKFDFELTTARTDTVTIGVKRDGTNNNTRTMTTKSFVDNMGRQVAVAENWVNATASGTNAGGGTNNEEDRVTTFAYNGLGQQTQITAINVAASTVNEVTKYLYDDAYNASLVTNAIYPDSSDTTSSGTDQLKTTYNLDGTPATRTDQRGVVMEYTYDNARRLLMEGATTIPSGVDGTVKSIVRTYDSLGRVNRIRSNDAAAGNGTTVDEIVQSYHSFGKVDTITQSHAGISGGSTPYAHFSYDLNATSGVYSKGLRRTRETHPCGWYTQFVYGSGDFNDALNRVSQVGLYDFGSGRDINYSYNGMGRVAKVQFATNSLKREMFNLDSAGTNVYNGWDRFGQPVDYRWQLDDKVAYTYDYAGNRLSRDVVTTSNNTRDQKYVYDGVHRLLNYDQGTLSSGSITSSNKQRSWQLDQLGNWAQTFSDLSQTTSEQTRTHNAANELTEIDSSNSHVAEDAAGNMTKLPKPTSWSAHFDLKYDAWNRLVEVKDGSNTVQKNQYDGLGRRIVRSVYSNGDLSHKIHYYYNDNWQLLEERKEVSGGVIDEHALSTYLWHPYYIDALAIRLYDEQLGGDTYSAQYFAHDANYNVTSVWGGSGGNENFERYSYSPYGEVTFLNSDYSTKSTQATSIANTHLYTGRELDPETGLQLNRHRFYASWLGRWATRDPIGYEGSEWNLYEYLNSNAIGGVDPLGMKYGSPNPGHPRPVPPGQESAGKACSHLPEDCNICCAKKFPLPSRVHDYMNCMYDCRTARGEPREFPSPIRWPSSCELKDKYINCSKSQCQYDCFRDAAYCEAGCATICAPLKWLGIVKYVACLKGCTIGCATYTTTCVIRCDLMCKDP